ncbi:hypothetical protein EDD22DRAFT_87011 [Suillus occidentalis]|nr:hypothetical protein EDD22DRAFT_87011 [Suillus occidentalis]
MRKRKSRFTRHCTVSTSFLLQVSECFHHAIQSVPQLAYRVALKAAGMKENVIPAGTVASQRHAILQKHLCTWLEPVVVDILPLLPSKAFWNQDQETDGIFGDVLWERLPDYQHRFTNILSHQSGDRSPLERFKVRDGPGTVSWWTLPKTC